MRIFLVIEQEIVIDVVTKPNGSWQLSDYEGSYDTIQEDSEGHFSIGDVYTMEQWNLYYPTVIAVEPIPAV